MVSYALFKLGELLQLPFDLCSITALRFLNLFLVCTLLPSITKSLYRHIHPDASSDTIELAGLLPALPLLSFFGNLYYTDVLSTATVLYCYLLAIRRKYGASAIVSAPHALTADFSSGRSVEHSHQANQYYLAGFCCGRVSRSGFERSRHWRTKRGGGIAHSSSTAPL